MYVFTVQFNLLVKLNYNEWLMGSEGKAAKICPAKLYFNFNMFGCYIIPIIPFMVFHEHFLNINIILNPPFCIQWKTYKFATT